MNDSRVVARLAGIGIAAVLSVVGFVWVFYVSFIGETWAKDNGNPPWFAWMGPLLCLAAMLLILQTLKKYFDALVKPMWKGV